MKANFLLIVLVMILGPSYGQNKDEESVRLILKNQTQAWNRGNLEKFMNGYWRNDSLKFIGRSGITYGYSGTLANYKKNYSDTTIMGELSFELLELKQLSNEYFFVLGKYFLKRTIGDASGFFTLIFRKINGEWVIISDHSS